MTRAALLALFVLLAACTTEAPQSCPGGQVGTFSFSGDKVDAGVLAPGLDPDPALTDCSVLMGFPGPSTTGPSLAFQGTLASDATGSAGILCRTNGPVLFGTRSGTRWVVEDSSDGAVLAGCDLTCAAHSNVIISGDVVPDAISPTDFQGALVEQLIMTGGSCGSTCALPCAARYTLAGKVVPP